MLYILINDINEIYHILMGIVLLTYIQNVLNFVLKIDKFYEYYLAFEYNL